ncbi:hypothetical protein [Actinoallomurus iriomotensis]|uniref:Uncharacterized protein n=1 Tax=Actinoallomurus iriomotensis TaxID=478107 RepID=A0A9W6VR84_9ACTN|nr:hypothetical protein [Actinoallomurus iriomotensis]GLY81953.1 hypothetical protein Airi01_102200 [Actinoallomurus iriomotensis]
METARDVLTTLARRYAFGDLAALCEAGAARLPSGVAAEVRLLCSFGQRLIDLDAEDFGMPERTGDPVVDEYTVPEHLLARARASRMPQSAKERSRGALRTLRPAYGLLLEVIAARWHRREMAPLVAAVHIASEYLPLLAWQPVLGHAGDPALLPTSVSGPGSRFGVPGGATRPRDCSLTRPQQSAAERALRVAREPGPGWRNYLDRQHSTVASALCTCAVSCRTPCDVVTRLNPDVLSALSERCRVAQEFADGALVRLRHAAPVGHGFGVPNPDEVSDAWNRTRTSLGRLPLGDRVVGDVADYPLPGLPEAFSAAAGHEIVPDTLLRDLSDHLVAILQS